MTRWDTSGRGHLPRRRSLALLAGLVVLFAGLTGVALTGTAEQVEHRYGDHPRQTLAAFWRTPADGMTQPGLVMVHGGHWSEGGPDDLADAAEWYAAHGFAVFSVGHRSTADTAWPGPRDDVLRAIGWIKAHARRFHLDPGRLAVLGAESGGHLAIQAGTYGAGGGRVRGVVGLSAVASPERVYAEAPTAATRAGRRALRDGTVLLARCTPADGAAGAPGCADRYTDMGVAAHADASDAPMLLFHSAADVVPAAHGQDVRAALTRAGQTDVTVRTVRGDRSGAALLDDTTVRGDVLRWLRAHTAPAASPAPKASTPPAEAVPGTGAVLPQRALTGAAVNGRVEVTTSYGPDPRNTVDVYYRPAPAAVTGAGRRPVLLLVHGGGWIGGDKSGWISNARWFTDRGFTVFAMNYRLTGTDRWPAPRTDVFRALAWIRRNAAAYGADPGRVALVGSSAGGQMAVSAGTYGIGTTKVKAVVALSPVVRPLSSYEAGDTAAATTGQRRLRDYSLLLARCTPGGEDGADGDDRECRRRWHDMDGLSRTGAGDPPVYTVHSQGDPVPAEQSAQLCRRLRQVRVGCTAVVVPGDGHAVELLKVPGVRDAVLQWLLTHV